MSMGRAFLSMSVANGVAALLGALATILAIRILAPEEWAVVAVVVGLGPSLGVLMSLGSVNYQIRALSRQGLRKARHQQASLFFVRRFIVGCVVVVIGIVLAASGASVFALIVLLAGLRFIRGGSSLLISANRSFKRLSVFLILEKLAYAMFAAMAVLFLEFTVHTLPIAYGASLVCFTGFALFSERLDLSFTNFRLAIRSIPDVWRGSGAFGAVSLISPLQQLDVVVVGAISGGVQAGYFAAGSRLTSGLNIAGAALSTVVLPYFSDKKREIKRVTYSVKWMSVIVAATLIVAGVFISAPTWVPLILGEEYVSAIGIVTIYLAAVLLSTVNAPFMSLLQAWDAERFVMWVSITQVLLGLVSLAVGSWLYDAAGAAIGFLTTTFVVTLVLIIRVKGEIAERRK